MEEVSLLLQVLAETVEVIIILVIAHTQRALYMMLIFGIAVVDIITHGIFNAHCLFQLFKSVESCTIN